MKKTTYIIVLAVIMASCKTASFYAKKGDKNFIEGNYEFASQNYQQALDKGAPKATMNFKIGECYRLSNRLSKASDYYKDAIDNKTQEQAAYYYYGLSLKYKGNYEGSKKYLDEYAKVGRDKRYVKLAQYESKKIERMKEILPSRSSYEIENLIKINSGAEDYNPVMYEGKIVFSSSRGEGELYGGSGYGFADLYIYDGQNISKFDESGKINAVNKHDASPTFSPDGKYMVFARSNAGIKKEENPNVDLYVSKKDETGGWGEPVRLNINSPTDWDGSPMFSRDGKKLYFASDRKGGKGGLDIYEATFQDGKFYEPKPISGSINTYGNEFFPYEHSDGTFYFASDGHVGYGGLDLFKQERDSNGKFVDKPVNMGKTINTQYDEFALVYAEKFKGYFSSNREGGMGGDDIYAFVEDKTPFYFLDLTVVEKPQNPNDSIKIIGNAKVGFKENNQEVHSDFTNEKGHYSHQLEMDKNYILTVKKDHYFTSMMAFDLNKDLIADSQKNEEGDYIIQKTIELDKIEKDKSYDITKLAGFDVRAILYDVDKANIRPDAAFELNKLVEFMNENQGLSIELGSHTDSRSSDDYNLLLSQRRADSAVAYMVNIGKIDRKRINAKGYGETQLLNKCDDGVTCTEEEHQINRRTEIRILDVKEVVKETHEKHMEEKTKKAEEEAQSEEKNNEEMEKLRQEALEAEKELQRKAQEEKDAQLKKEQDKKSQADKELEEYRKYLEMKKKFEETEKNKKDDGGGN